VAKAFGFLKLHKDGSTTSLFEIWKTPTLHHLVKYSSLSHDPLFSSRSPYKLCREVVVLWDEVAVLTNCSKVRRSGGTTLVVHHQLQFPS